MIRAIADPQLPEPTRQTFLAILACSGWFGNEHGIFCILVLYKPV
jgi:hypothetical protein